MGKPELISEAIRLDREAHRAMRQPMFEGWKGLNLTVPQLRSLFFISIGSSTPGKLAAALGVTPPNVTGIVDRLVEQGLVARRESEHDRRMLLLRTTEKGDSILSDLREWRTNTMYDVLSRLSEADLQLLIKGLSSVVRAAHDWQKQIAGESEGQDVRHLESAPAV